VVRVRACGTGQAGDCNAGDNKCAVEDGAAPTPALLPAGMPAAGTAQTSAGSLRRMTSAMAAFARTRISLGLCMLGVQHATGLGASVRLPPGLKLWPRPHPRMPCFCKSPQHLLQHPFLQRHLPAARVPYRLDVQAVRPARTSQRRGDRGHAEPRADLAHAPPGRQVRPAQQLLAERHRRRPRARPVRVCRVLACAGAPGSRCAIHRATYTAPCYYNAALRAVCNMQACAERRSPVETLAWHGGRRASAGAPRFMYRSQTASTSAGTTSSSTASGVSASDCCMRRRPWGSQASRSVPSSSTTLQRRCQHLRRGRVTKHVEGCSAQGCQRKAAQHKKAAQFFY